MAKADKVVRPERKRNHQDMNLLLLTLTTLSAFAIRESIAGAAEVESMAILKHMEGSLGRLKRHTGEYLHWRIFCPSEASVESDTVKCEMKCTRACRKILAKAVQKCNQYLHIGCITRYFKSSDKDGKCKIKCYKK